MPTLPDASVHLVITSPPYFQQRDYGGGMGEEPTLRQYLDRLLAILRESVRVIQPQGSIVFNLGDKYADASLLLVPYRFAIEASDSLPIRLVNAITWVKSNPTPRQFRRRLVSSTEPFFHFVKSPDYYYAIDAFDSPVDDDGAKPTRKRRTNPGQRYFELIDRSQLRDDQKEQARAALWAVIAEVKAGKIQDFRMKIRGLHSEPFGGQAGGRQTQLLNNGFTIIRIHGNPIKRDVIEVPVESLKGRSHPAVYPVRLVGEFLRLLTRPGDIVLDPFMGSGSTAVACKRMGRHYIGFELNPDYCQAAIQRIAETPADPVRLL